MTIDNRVTIARPEDILGFIPHVLGMWPEESLVAMTLRGGILGATLRVDLPSRRTGNTPADFTSRIRDYLEADQGADGVLLAVFSDDGWADGDALAKHMPLISDLELVLARGGLALRDAWLIGADHWRSAFCTDLTCCPVRGRPVSQIRDSRLNAEMVYRGSSVRKSPGLVAPSAGASEGKLPSDRPTDKDGTTKNDKPAKNDKPTDKDRPTEGTEFDSAEAAALKQILGVWHNRRHFEEMLDIWNRVLDSGLSEEFDSASAAFLRASLRIPAWRDAVVVMAAAGRAAAIGGAEAFGFFRGGSGGKSVLDVPAGLRSLPNIEAARRTDKTVPTKTVPSAGASKAGKPEREDIDALRYGDVLLGLYPEIPDWGSMAALDRVASSLARRAGGEARAAALTVQGWIKWCQGSGSFAHEFFEQADAEQPGYRLADLLNEVVRRGMICGWAKNRSSAWQKFGGTAA